MINYREEILKIKEARGLTQGDLADLIGLSLRGVQYMLRADKPTASRIHYQSLLWALRVKDWSARE